MRRSIRCALVALVTLAVVAVTAPTTVGAYGGASHDMWQIGVSFNCNNSSFCAEMGGTGGDWGWVEFDRSADGTQTWGDGEVSTPTERLTRL